MENKPPFVSIIVPVYNGEATIEACIQSLLNQDYPKQAMEIIVADNGSKDATLKLLQPFSDAKKITVVHENKILNSYGARNKGAAAAKGEVLAFTDADCIAKQNWITMLLSSYDNSKIGAFIGDNLIYKPKTVIERYYDSHKTLSLQKKDLRVFPGMRTSNCAVRRACFEQLGGFHTDATTGGDSDFLKRMITATTYTFKVELDAVVFNKNYDTLMCIFKRFLRFGTNIDNIKNDRFLSPNYISKTHNAACIAQNLIAMLVRLVYFPAVALTGKYKGREISDRSLFLMEPVIVFVEYTGVAIGRTFKLKSFR